MDNFEIDDDAGQERCLKCGRFIEKTGFLLCDPYYEEFMKYVSRRPYLYRIQENPLRIWLQKLKEEKN